eukprot:TRINITY_DN3780_c0_g1_i1.p1 TRINITY_DN3780_c0_g1~~TRINITY_DN3780_c0_g1_i1.p1  ORF type:complete len:144 (+),score=30.45 TRINITY_DN3780_c0_g1_i1:110-541(+)
MNSLVASRFAQRLASTTGLRSSSISALTSSRFFSLHHVPELTVANVEEELIDQKLGAVYVYDENATKDISSVVQKAIAHTSNAGGIHYSQVSANKKDLLAKIGASTVPSILVYQKGNLVERLDSLNPENLEYRLGKIAWLYNT